MTAEEHRRDLFGGDRPDAGADGDAPEPDATVRRERSFRGISERLAGEYLRGLGGDPDDEGRLAGDGWTASLSAEMVEVGPTIELTEVTVVVEGRAGDVDPLVAAFARKAMRAGG